MKRCFKCGVEKPTSEFYSHPKMADGLLGKCKDCAKNDATERHQRKMNDPAYVLAERKRHRDKQRQIRAAGMEVPIAPHQRRLTTQRYREANELRAKAHTLTGNAIKNGRLKRRPCEVCGSGNVEAHHDDYSRPLDVRWLCVTHHAEYHVKLRERMCIERLSAIPA